MALTKWEGLKVTGETLNKIGIEGEAFEDTHPGEEYKPGRGEIIGWVIDTLKRLGLEIAD